MSTQRIISWRVYCLQISFPARNIVRGSAAAGGKEEKKRCRHATEEEGPRSQPRAVRSLGRVSQHGPDLQKMCRENQEYLHLGKLGLDESRQDRYMHA